MSPHVMEAWQRAETQGQFGICIIFLIRDKSEDPLSPSALIRENQEGSKCSGQTQRVWVVGRHPTEKASSCLRGPWASDRRQHLLCLRGWRGGGMGGDPQAALPASQQ